MKKNMFKNIFKEIKIRNLFSKKEKEVKETNFIPLYPNYNSDNDIYVKRLQEALEDNRILNIGVTGPYGSGKSSVLLELINRLPDKNKCIIVSLAAFGNKNKEKNDKVNEAGKGQIADNNGDGKRDIKDLEVGILQQIIYKVDSKKIPLSKIVRIKEEREYLFRGIITTIIYFLNLDILNEIKEYIINVLKNIPKYEQYFTLNISSIVLHFIMFILIYKALGVLLRKFNITSVSFKGVDLTTESKTESILNKYIDEIIYILKKSKYNIIIFEDIDRFNEEEIFVKLRELNKIINDNDGIIKNGKVRFIYAVKDDILPSAAERTKFFDFIVPIIPIVSNNNAQLKFIETLEKIGLKGIVSEEIIQEVSYFVNDMRLVINICNEFKVYYEKIYKKIDTKNGNYSIDQLFAIIAYKNLEPEDFKDMQYDKGHINELIKNKKYIVNLVEDDLNTCENKRKLKENEFEENVKKIKEEILDWYDAKSSTVNEKYFVGDNLYEDSETFVENAVMEEIFKNGIKGDGEKRPRNLDNIFSKNSWKEQYYKLQKEKDIEMQKINDKIQKLKNENTLNETLKNILRNDSEVFNRIFKQITLDEEDKKRLKSAISNFMLMNFVKNGYITEEYRYYINNIYIENMTIEEYNFIATVKLGKEQNYYTTTLPNIKIVNSRLNESDFEKKNILNFDLFKYLFEKEKEIETETDDKLVEIQNKLHSLVLHIEKDIENDGNFFFYCMDNIDDKTSCLNYIIGYAIDLWGTISVLENDKINRYMEYIVKYGDSDTFEALDVFDEFSYSISNLKNIKLSDMEKIYRKSKNIRIKIKDISNFDKDTQAFILNKNIYELNEINVNIILKGHYNFENTEQEELNNRIFEKLTSISSSITNYVKENINEFLENVIIDTNRILTEDELIKIIACRPSNTNLEKIVRNLKNNCIKKIENIKNVKYWRILLKNEKIEPNIINILEYMNKYEFSIELEKFLANENNIKLIIERLKKHRKTTLKNKGIEVLIRNMCYSEKISSDDLYNFIDIYLGNKDEKIYVELDKIPEINWERIIYLIKNNWVNFSIKNYEIVKNEMPEYLVKFCKDNIEVFIKEYNSLNVNDELVKKLVTSDIREIYRKKLLELWKNEILL